MLTAYYALAGRVTRTQTARRFWVPIPRFREGGVLDFSSKILRRFRSIFPTRCLLPPPQPLVLPPQPSEHGCSRPAAHKSSSVLSVHTPSRTGAWSGGPTSFAKRTLGGPFVRSMRGVFLCALPLSAADSGTRKFQIYFDVTSRAKWLAITSRTSSSFFAAASAASLDP